MCTLKIHQLIFQSQKIYLCIYVFKVNNKDMPRKLNEDKQILNAIWQTKHQWMGHVLRTMAYHTQSQKEE